MGSGAGIKQTMRWTKEQYLEFMDKKSSKKPSKYNSKKTEIDGIIFDSQKEANYYCQLKIMRAAGEIRDFALQPKYELQESFEKHGKKIKTITYIADFLVVHSDGSTEIIDVKGFETKDFKIKKKMFEYRYCNLKLTVI